MDYFLQPSPLDCALPDFAAFTDDDLLPAFRHAVAEQAAEIDAIATNPEPATWENTYAALEASGQMLDRVLAIVHNYVGTLATDSIQAIDEAISPELAAHSSAILLNEDLYRRLTSLADADIADAALVEYWMRRFRNAGIALDDAGRARMREIDAELAVLSSRYATALQRSTQELSTDVALGLPTVQPELETTADPELRERIHSASRRRGVGVVEDLVLSIVRLRAERAELLGYAHHADYVLEKETADSLDDVLALLREVTVPAVTNAADEDKRAHDKALAEVGETPWGPAHRPYWDAQLRAEELAVDEEELRRYFPRRQVLVDGVFFAAQRLYGIEVIERRDLQGYHEDVDVWEVREESGETIGLLLTDLEARPTKRGGAWMSSFVTPSHLLGTKPVVLNVMNTTSELLSIDDVRTMFHEFGHALHGLFSDVDYPSLAGTNVPRDFVEFPSQINENWAFEPSVLRNYARHVDTGEALSEELREAVIAQSRWGQGFATSEYVGACWVDLAWHMLSHAEAKQVTSVADFEAAALEEAGVPVEPRYSSTYFNHIFAGGYSADYWSYLWAEVLDADGFDAFVATGAAGEEAPDPEDVRHAGERFRRIILSRGATIDYNDAYWMFRGQQRSVEPLLRRRGLVDA